ncbi:hypothetical protein [Nostoc sp.]|uniref:hypothetical protein n=1 Tax=Nostoc sp. TaxID=1180 RepID=UPI002FFD51CA
MAQQVNRLAGAQQQEVSTYTQILAGLKFKILQMLDAIQDKMGIENDEDSELADLEMETKPEDVLVEIERLQQLALKRKKLNKLNHRS